MQAGLVKCHAPKAQRVMTFHGQPQGRPVQFVMVEYKGLYATASWGACINTQFKGGHGGGLFCVAQTLGVKGLRIN